MLLLDVMYKLTNGSGKLWDPFQMDPNGLIKWLVHSSLLGFSNKSMLKKKNAKRLPERMRNFGHDLENHVLFVDSKKAAETFGEFSRFTA